MKYVNLSHPFHPGLGNVTNPPTFDVAVRPVKTLKDDGINTMILEVADHVGTHIDAPVHIIENGAGIADLPLERCFRAGGRPRRSAWPGPSGHG